MNYLPIIKKVNLSNYDEIVSIGNKCPTTMILRELNIYKESFPFDSIPTTPRLILKYLQDQTDFFPKKYTVRTADDVWFGHYDLGEKYDETIETLKRRFERLFTLLKSNQRILFVYTSEADVYNEMSNRYHDNYKELGLIAEYIQLKYNTSFTILAIHTNQSYENTKHIINYTIQVPDVYLSDDMSTHTSEVCTQYRKVLKDMLKDILI